MDTHYSPVKRQVTPKYVLSVLRDRHRQTFHIEYGREPDIELCFDTTVKEWFFEEDIISWRKLGRWMNEFWRISISDREWKNVLKPAKLKTLRNVCRLIAQKTCVSAVREETFFGKTCRPASVFLTIQSIMHDAGVDTTAIGPSTTLDKYTSQYPELFLGPIMMLAPGVLPQMRIKKTGFSEIEDIFLLLFLGVIVLVFLVYPLIMASPLVLTLIYLFYKACRPVRNSVHIRIGELRTFRDLSLLIADQVPVKLF